MNMDWDKIWAFSCRCNSGSGVVILFYIESLAVRLIKLHWVALNNLINDIPKSWALLQGMGRPKFMEWLDYVRRSPSAYSR